MVVGAAVGALVGYGRSAASPDTRQFGVRIGCYHVVGVFGVCAHRCPVVGCSFKDGREGYIGWHEGVEQLAVAEIIALAHSLQHDVEVEACIVRSQVDTILETGSCVTDNFHITGFADGIVTIVDVVHIVSVVVAVAQVLEFVVTRSGAVSLQVGTPSFSFQVFVSSKSSTV